MKRASWEKKSLLRGAKVKRKENEVGKKTMRKLSLSGRGRMRGKGQKKK